MTSEKSSASPMNPIFFLLVAAAVLYGAADGRMQEVTDESFNSAKNAVSLAINLIGIMGLWLGLVRVLEASGLMESLAKGLTPVARFLFPEIPPNHPAMGAMLLNIAANMLGLGNAATPFGIKAMVELNKLNKSPGVATHAMCLFLAINTSSVTLLPLGVIGVRAAAGASDPANVILPSLLATICSTIVAIALCTIFSSFSDKRDETLAPQKTRIEPIEVPPPPPTLAYEHLREPSSTPLKICAALTMAASLLLIIIKSATSPLPVATFLLDEVVSFWLMPLLMLFILSYGLLKGVKVYEAVTEGAKEGFTIAIKIIPFLITILVAIGMFRAAGALDLLTASLTPITSLIGMPPEALPMALIRPLSGSGAFGVMSSIVEHDPDSYLSYLVSTMQGSTETTFYVMAVYFGAVGITRVRYALAAALAADIVGALAACFWCAMLW